MNPIDSSETGSGRAQLSRRGVLVTAATVAGLGITAVGRPAMAAGPGPTLPSKAAWKAARTENGWPIISSGSTVKVELEGMDGITQLRPGQVSTVLTHVVRRFNYEIGEIRGSEVHGFRTETAVAADYESNYLSGTAVAIRPGLYPAGSAGNLLPLELLVVRDILAECEGVVRWAGDDPKIPKEGHFQIDVAPGSTRLNQLVVKLRGWQTEPDRGAGAPVNLIAPARLKAARALARIQRG